MDHDATSPVAAGTAPVRDDEAADRLGLLGRRDFSLLIVDDAVSVRQEVRRLAGRLGVFGTCREAENGVEAYKRVLEAAPDLILCDLVMPGVDGLKFLALIRAREELRDIPVILVTGKTDVETKIRGLELGASDYVTKPFDAGELLARIKVQLKIKALQDELRRSNELLQELSSTDALTKLFNRRYFMAALGTEFERTDRYGSPLGMVMLDIDHFKRLNDTFGHQVGDQALRGLGALIHDAVRTTDIAARYGGEEFCMLLPETDLEGAAEFAHRLRLGVEDKTLLVDGHEVSMTVSIGVSACPNPAVESGDDLIRLADDALYRAKRAGRNRVMVSER
ncbi:MAG: diguanylate cyclase [Deferrisomatales bacterium]|nr:diguanylate cyclase [Deferrisomatales bacterium]